ncbi:ATP-binding cassette domain-containing protein [Sodalis glossinidius]
MSRVALLGGNDADKTTLLRVLAGVYHPTAGRLSTR